MGVGMFSPTCGLLHLPPGSTECSPARARAPTSLSALVYRMAFVPRRPPRLHTSLHLTTHCRQYATVRPVTLVGKPPDPPDGSAPPVAAPATLESLVLARLRTSSAPGLPTLLQQYDANEGRILDTHLPYESRPNTSRSVKFERVDVLAENGIVMIAHAIQYQDRYKVALCSGFALNISPYQVTKSSDVDGGQIAILTCAHTLEEVNNPFS